MSPHERSPLPSPGPQVQVEASPRSSSILELMRPDAVAPQPAAGSRPYGRPGPVSDPLASPRVRRALRRCAAGGLRVFLAVVFSYALLFNFSVVRGSSMAPGIHDGDRILVNQLSLLFTSVERGDIVVLRYPLDPSVDYIKRVVGMPGDRIRITGGEVYVNDERLEEPYVGSPDPYTHLATVVEPGHYFVLGDNRLHSSDSREFGQVPRAYLRGQVDLRVWPPSRMGAID